MACSCPTTRQAIQNRLKNAVDAGKPIQTKQFTNATSTTGSLDFSQPTKPGIVFGAAPAAAAQQNTQPTTPISPPPSDSDVPMAPSMDDSVRTEFNRIDGEYAGIRNDISGLNSKIDGFGSQLAEAIEKPVLAAQRPKDAPCPDVVPQNYVWTVTRRSTFEKWQPLRTMVTAVADGTFRGLAWSAQGIPLTDWTIEAPFQCAMSEDTACNVAAQWEPDPAQCVEPQDDTPELHVGHRDILRWTCGCAMLDPHPFAAPDEQYRRGLYSCVQLADTLMPLYV